MFLESVDVNSKCVDFEVRTSWVFNSTTIPPIYGGACYEVCLASSSPRTVDRLALRCASVCVGGGGGGGQARADVLMWVGTYVCSHIGVWSKETYLRQPPVGQF